MRKRLLRSVLVAAFSVAVAFGALSGHSDDERDLRADTHWPSVGVNSVVDDTDAATDGAGS
jgi:hypothetical protein